MKRLLAIVLSLALLLPAALPAPASAGSFSDVPRSHWAHDVIEEAYRDGVIAGTAVNEASGVRQFSPESTLTFAQFTVIMTRAFFPQDIPATTAPGAPWYEANKIAAEKNNLFANLRTTMNSGCTRYLMAQVMYNILSVYGVSTDHENAMAIAARHIPDWAGVPRNHRSAVAVCYHLNLLSGVDQHGTFAGEQTLTRAQCAAIYPRLKKVVSGGSQSKPGTIGGPAEADDGALAVMVDLMNDARAKAGVGPLVIDPTLSAAATLRAREAQQKESHTRPDGRKASSVLDDEFPVERLAFGENLSFGRPSAEAAFNGWMNSNKGHRETILDPHFKKVGIGYYYQEDSTMHHYWCQIFTD